MQIKKIFLASLIPLSLTSLTSPVNAQSDNEINVHASIQPIITLNYEGKEIQVNAKIGDTVQDLLNNIGFDLSSVDSIYYDKQFTQKVEMDDLLIDNFNLYFKAKENKVIESPKKEDKHWDDGGPFTTDECGSVYDRWGNLIWKAPICQIKSEDGYNLVQTDDKNEQVVTETTSVFLTAKGQSYYSVNIPKEIDISKNETNYEIIVTADLGANEILSILPDESFEIENEYHPNEVILVEHDITELKLTDLNNSEAKINGILSHDTLKPGNWKGSFNISISLKGV